MVCITRFQLNFYNVWVLSVSFLSINCLVKLGQTIHCCGPYNKSDLQSSKANMWDIEPLVTITALVTLLLLNVVQQNLQRSFDYNITRLVYASPDLILLDVGIIILFLCHLLLRLR